VISRDINKVAVDQMIYCCWCDPEGKVIDDGTITRLAENDYRWDGRRIRACGGSAEYAGPGRKH